MSFLNDALQTLGFQSWATICEYSRGSATKSFAPKNRRKHPATSPPLCVICPSESVDKLALSRLPVDFSLFRPSSSRTIPLSINHFSGDRKLDLHTHGTLSSVREVNSALGTP